MSDEQNGDTIETKSSDSLGGKDLQDVQTHLRLRAPVIYQVVRQEGEEELKRPLLSLWWSGVAAGLAICLSVVAEGLLLFYLPERPWTPLVSSFGYCVGFIVAVLGRLQLFTENTITAVLPVVARPTLHNLFVMVRLWGVVFAANMVGALVFAAAATWGGIFPADQMTAFLDLARHALSKEPMEMLLYGIPAGFLVAVMVWMIPSAESAAFYVVVMMTYLIALGSMTHVVAGSAEAFLLLLAGEFTLGRTIFGFLVPVFIGNVIGGTVLFALLAYGQVKREL
jgi:formate/nitrite transporter FocA (FNT family)